MKTRTSPSHPSRFAPHTYRTAEVARILDSTPAVVRRMAHAGFAHPAQRGRAFEFAFQDLVLLRTAQGLLDAEVPPRRVRRALSELTRQLPPDRPLSGIRIYADGRQVVARDGHAAWEPDSGQVVFSFAVEDLVRETAAVMPVRHPTPPIAKRPDTAARWFDHALECEHNEEIAAATDAYRRALELDPHLADAYINLGRLVHQQGDAAEAARLYHLALGYAADDSVAHYNLAIALEDQQQHAAAAKHYEQALALDPNFADAHFNLGRLYDRLGQGSQAVRHLLAYKRLIKDK